MLGFTDICLKTNTNINIPLPGEMVVTATPSVGTEEINWYQVIYRSIIEGVQGLRYT